MNVNFLNYVVIIDAMPVSWKSILLDNYNNDNHTTYTHSIDKIINIQIKICIIMYTDMQQSIVQVPISVFNKRGNIF